MTRIAVDIVLLPPKGIMNRAIQINGKLIEKFGNKIVLNQYDCLPHISLAMGCIDKKDILAIGKELKRITEKFLPVNLTVSGVSFSKNRDEIMSGFEIDKTDKIRALHEASVKVLKKLSIPADKKDFLGRADEISVGWVNNFFTESSFRKYKPHITLGFGEANASLKPMKFTATHLALCRLGNYCTCRKVLFSIDMK